jgi:hypothetical protein
MAQTLLPVKPLKPASPMQPQVFVTCLCNDGVSGKRKLPLGFASLSDFGQVSCLNQVADVHFSNGNSLLATGHWWR